MRRLIAFGLACSLLGLSSFSRAQPAPIEATPEPPSEPEPRSDPEPEQESDPESERWLPPLPRHVDDDQFFYFGGALHAPLPLVWLPRSGAGAGAGAGAAFRGGFVHHHFEVMLELSGVVATAGEGPMLLADGTVTVGGLIPMSPHLSWPMRFGGGGGVAALRDGAVGFAEARADVFGVAVRTSDQLRVELDLPSYRILLYDQGLLGMSWVTALTFAYVPSRQRALPRSSGDPGSFRGF